jgi:riboflavin biosynthesis pyrimidine reductase
MPCEDARVRVLLPEPRPEATLEEVYAYPPTGPWLRANMVASVDGAAVVEGSSRPLSSPADRRLIGALRALSDVVLVGAGTARSEGYRALVPNAVRRAQRAERGQPDAPVLAVVTSSCRLDPASPLFGREAPRTIVITTAEAAAGPGRPLAEVADVVATPGRQIDLRRALGALDDRGHRRMLCEGGPALLGRLADDDLLDELCLTISPHLTGAGAPGVLGPVRFQPPRRLSLLGVCEEDGWLFTRWLRGAVPVGG